MSECLMAQRGGKYTRGRTITDDNVTPVHYLFEQIWSANLSNDSFCSVYTDDQGNLYVSQQIGGITKLSETDGSQIWANNNSSYDNVRNSAVVDESGDIYVVYKNTHYGTDAKAKSIRKLSGIDGTEIWDKNDFQNASSVIVDNTGDIYVSYFSKVEKLSGIDGAEIWDMDIPYGVTEMGFDNSGDIILLGNTVTKLSNVDKTIIWNSGTLANNVYDFAISKNNIYVTTNEGIKILSDVDGYIISTINMDRGSEFILSDNAGNLYIASQNYSYANVDKISSINNKKYGTYFATSTNGTGGSCGFAIYNDYIYILTQDSSMKITIVNKCYSKNIYTIIS